MLLSPCCGGGDGRLPASLGSPSRLRTVFSESDKACGGTTTSQTAPDWTEHPISSSRASVWYPLISRPIYAGLDGRSRSIVD